ncbi:prepilin-type N-terminal cleavage/methylation domain-containing protein, partial [Klebsiella pneumoniae]
MKHQSGFTLLEMLAAPTIPSSSRSRRGCGRRPWAAR